MTNGQDSYQPQQQYAPQPQMYPSQRTNIVDNFVGPGKFGLFIMLAGLMLFIGLLFLNLVTSGLVRENVLVFLADLLIDIGLIAIICLIIVAGVVRVDLPEKVRSTMLRAGGFVAGIFVIMLIIRMATGSAFSSIFW